MRDGFFSVGDLARIDGDGYVYLASREHDMVISGGVNIYPAEIEEHLHRHPASSRPRWSACPTTSGASGCVAFVVRRGQAPRSPPTR